MHAITTFIFPTFYLISGFVVCVVLFFVWLVGVGWLVFVVTVLGFIVCLLGFCCYCFGFCGGGVFFFPALHYRSFVFM